MAVVVTEFREGGADVRSLIVAALKPFGTVPPSAIRSASRFIEASVVPRACDHEAVSECVRCTAVAMSRWALTALALLEQVAAEADELESHESRSPDGDGQPQSAGVASGEAECLPYEAQATNAGRPVGSSRAEIKHATAGSKPADSQLDWIARYCDQVCADGIMPSLAWFGETADAIRRLDAVLALPRPESTPDTE